MSLTFWYKKRFSRFLILNQYRIPRKYLLNHTGDVNELGVYTTPYDNESERFGASLLALSATRVEVIVQSEIYGGYALSIAIRYSGVRKQFGPGEQEIPVLEYQTQVGIFVALVKEVLKECFLAIPSSSVPGSNLHSQNIYQVHIQRI